MPDTPGLGLWHFVHPMGLGGLLTSAGCEGTLASPVQLDSPMVAASQPSFGEWGPATSLATASTRTAPKVIRQPYTIVYYIRLSNTILYYTILYYTILYYTILYYTILYYTILYYTILYYTILYYTILYYTILYYTILYYTILYYTILYYTILYYIIV